MDTQHSSNEQTFVLHTLHRGRLIQLLLGSLFLLGIAVSASGIGEIPKILVLLICLPLLLFGSVKWSQQPSTWVLAHDSLRITKGPKEWVFPITEITHLKNHLRSGGNLLAIYRKGKLQPTRCWRNKLCQGVDKMDELLARLQQIGVPVMLG